MMYAITVTIASIQGLRVLVSQMPARYPSRLPAAATANIATVASTSRLAM